jgi:hypothetical protein
MVNFEGEIYFEAWVIILVPFSIRLSFDPSLLFIPLPSCSLPSFPQPSSIKETEWFIARFADASMTEIKSDCC